jgi:hypothetical protein
LLYLHVLLSGLRSPCHLVTVPIAVPVADPVPEICKQRMEGMLRCDELGILILQHNWY